MSQFEHLKGFSPVWVLSCAASPLGFEKLLSQTLQLNLLSGFILDCSVATNKNISPVRLDFLTATDTILNIQGTWVFSVTEIRYLPLEGAIPNGSLGGGAGTNCQVPKVFICRRTLIDVFVLCCFKHF